MKGIINKGIQEFVETKFGATAWEEVRSLAGCDEPFFAISQDYPDEMSLALIRAGSKVSGLPMETVMLECGRFMVPNTLKRSYPTYFAVGGSTARDFLANMSRVHEMATRSIPNSAPPRFDYEWLADGRLVMRYYSKRKLCPVLRGLILGVGDYFGEKLEVRETTCQHKGEPHCTMEVSFPNGK